MRRSDHSRLLAGIALVAAAIALPMAAGQTAAGASGRNPNAMMPVQPGMSAASLPHAAVFGVTPPGTPETVSFVLREQNLFQLEAAVEQGVTNYLSVSQFAQTYGQSQDNISQLQDYLARFGITTQVDADDVDVVANGTAGEFDAALVVQQHQYYVPEVPGRDGMRPVPPQWVHGTRQLPELPYRLSRFILAILGLTNYGPFDTQMVHADSALSTSGAGSSDACVALTGLPDGCNTPASFASNYGLDPLYGQGATGAGQTIAIVTLAALDEGAPEYFWQNVLGLPASTRTVTVVNVDGGPGAPSNAAGTGETDLDVEQAGGVAPDANVIVYQAPDTDYGFADAFFQAASDNIASTVSASWLDSETAVEAAIASGSETSAYETAFDEAFLEMAEQGQSGFLPAGDWGAYAASVDAATTNLSVESSADSPFITAAGGTTLPWTDTFTGAGGTVTVDVASQRTWGWDYLWQPIATLDGAPLASVAEAAVVGGGGGFSSIEPMPSYQQDVPGTRSFSAIQYLTPANYQNVNGVVEPTTWNFNPTPSVTNGFGWGRALPDVSTDADPETGYLLWEPSAVAAGQPALTGGWGGTSFVAPQLNGSTAVIDSFLGHRVGFWNPAIYSFATGKNSPFTPLDQSGAESDNLYYTGTPGLPYNEGCGLGYPNLSELANDFSQGVGNGWTGGGHSSGRGGQPQLSRLVVPS